MENTEIKLSIVVPVYNVSKYLVKCLDSLLSQDLPLNEYEIIVVDDGSTDDSGMLADEYAKKHPKFIKVIHQENRGLSGARNSGIKIAKGKYIQFVDSDDYLEPNVLKTLVDKMESDNLDILRFNYQNVNEQYEVFEPYKHHKPFVDYRDEVCDGVTFLNERLGYGCYAWQFMLKADLLRDEANLFMEGIYFEDTQWTPRILLQSKRVTSVDLMVYDYLLRQGSITNSISEEKKRKVLEDKLFLVEDLQCQMRSVSDNRWFKGMISATALSIISFLALNFYQEKDVYLRRLKELDVYPLSTYHTAKSTMYKIKMINLSTLLFCWIIAYKNRAR